MRLRSCVLALDSGAMAALSGQRLLCGHNASGFCKSRRNAAGAPRLGMRSLTTNSAMRALQQAKSWFGGLESLKQLVGLFVQQREAIRTRYLIVKSTAKEELALVEEVTLKKGMLMEILKDGKPVCVVVDRPDGKKNWAAVDQYGNTHSVQPRKVRFVVPGDDDFKPADIADFIKSAKALEDFSLLEIAWQEVVGTERSVSTLKLAEILFGNATPIECYATHCMLSSKQEFFRRKQKGHAVFYEPRSPSEVQELQKQFAAETAAQLEVENYVNAIKSAIAQPYGSKPAPSSWFMDRFSSSRTGALQAFALEACTESERNLAAEVLDALGVSKTPQTAVDVLIRMGVFKHHQNLELLKSRIPCKFSDQQLSAARLLEKEPVPDAFLYNRADLTWMKVYTIDSDTAQEIDDGLSAVELPDGRIQLWIHIADPTRWVEPEHPVDREARSRGTTVYLPEKTIPMFPANLAVGPMSLRQSEYCCAVSICVVLNGDGSIAEYFVVCSTIRPSVRLTYELADELIMLQLDEERELNILARAAQLRYRWRQSQGAIDMTLPQPDVKVKNPDSLEPEIQINIVDMSTPSGQLVTEMMILCGEAIAIYGNEKLLPLPYRGQTSMAVEMSFTQPLQHNSLGLLGYVQFTSPIRRYSDLLAHYQVKASLLNLPVPFSSTQLESLVMASNARAKEAKRLASTSVRYWLLEYLRRRPRNEAYEATVVKVRDGNATVFMRQVGIHGSVNTNIKLEVGGTVKVLVTGAHPRKDSLELELLEVVSTAAEAACA